MYLNSDQSLVETSNSSSPPAATVVPVVSATPVEDGQDCPSSSPAKPESPTSESHSTTSMQAYQPIPAPQMAASFGVQNSSFYAGQTQAAYALPYVASEGICFFFQVNFKNMNSL